MSQDKFWEQWSSGAGQQNPADPPAAGEPAPGGVDADVLAAWLKSLPPNDPLVPPPTHSTPGPSSSPADLAAAWPPAAPVDPFAGIQKSAGGAASEWDLTFDPAPGVPAAPAPPAPAPPPYAAPSGPVTPAPYAPPAYAPPAAAPPAAPAAPLPDFALDLGGVAGPAPGASPHAPAPPAAPYASPVGAASAPPAAPAVSPFGPPPPPMAPPPEALQAPPLKLEITTGRRTIEQVIHGEALIGRPDATRGLHPEIDLRLDDAVSRRHAKIFVRGSQYILTDLNSTNGTRYNRQWLPAEKEVPLKAGDEIEVGELTLIRVLEAPSNA